MIVEIKAYLCTALNEAGFGYTSYDLATPRQSKQVSFVRLA